MRKLLIASFAFSAITAANASSYNLMNITASALNMSEAQIGNHQECFLVAKSTYDYLYNIPLEKIDLSQYSKKDLKKALDQSFQARLNIRESLKEYDTHEPFAKECLSSVRSVTRAFRYMEDAIITHLEDTTKDDYVTLDGKGSFFQTNPSINFENYNDLQSGDLILSRGGAYTSAAIARIGVDDAQFSHLSFVYKDEKGVLHTTEAHIEIGSVIAPIIKNIEQKNVRSVVFRYKDQALAHKAAKFMYQKIKRFSATHKENLYYDFGMNYKNNDQIFCSEIVYDGFRSVTNGKVDVPLYKSKFPEYSVPFLNQIGIKVTKDSIKTFETFAPADIEFDTRFTLVAEWRRPNKLHDSKVKDVVLSKILEWMKLGYKLKPTTGVTMTSIVAWLGRRIPFVKKALIERLPMNMTITQLKVFQVLEKVGEKIQISIEEKQKSLGREMSFKEMFGFLESLRQSDERNFLKMKKIKRQIRRLRHGAKASWANSRKIKKLKKQIPTVIFHDLYAR